MPQKILVDGNSQKFPDGRLQFGTKPLAAKPAIKQPPVVSVCCPQALQSSEANSSGLFFVFFR